MIDVVDRIDEDGSLRVGVAGCGDDWLGPGRPLGGGDDGWVAAVRPDAGGLRLVLGSTPARTGVARPGGFTDLLLGWRFEPRARADGGIPNGTTAVGFQVAEFAFPTRSDASLATFFLLPHRPAALGLLLLVAPDGTTLLLAPVAPHQHSATIAVVDGTVGVGLHGDLDEVPAGFAAEVLVVAGATPGEAVDAWAAACRGDVVRPGRHADVLGARLSYWTDNGAAYWYRTEPGHTVSSGIGATVEDLADRGVPVGSVQIDSWWYPHAVLRPFDTEEWVVPPTGMLEWEARPDVLPDGLAALRDGVGGRPLVAHTRHLSARSPYVEAFPCWVDGDAAHPSTPALYEHLLDRCVQQGIEVFEHDWLVECFTGVRPLRAEPARAPAWLAGLDAAARDRGLTIQFCMATLADMVAAASLPRVTSVRTSGDSGYLVGPGFLWAWFLLVNRLARPLGLHPFADVLHAGSDVGALEAVLSTLSAGPVGIGDRLGAADATVLRPCVRADGRLVKPDVPIAATDDAFLDWPFGRARPLVGETWSDKAAGRWRYVLAMNPDDSGPSTVDVAVADREGCAIWDWRAGAVVEAMRATLAAHDWRLWVEAPLVEGVAVFGDPALYATAGDLRLADVSRSREIRVVGAPGETCSVACWSADDGTWTISVELGETAEAIVRID